MAIDEVEQEYYHYEEEEDFDDEQKAEKDEKRKGGRVSNVKRKRYTEDDDHRSQRKSRRSLAKRFVDDEAEDTDGEEYEDDGDGEEDFIVELPKDNENRRMNRRPFLPLEDDQEDVEAMARRLRERYDGHSHIEYEYDEDMTDVQQQALLPSIKDPKLWMVKCQVGHEREAAVCLMQKSIDKGAKLQINSAISLDHLKNYIYVEANKEAHVREACSGLRHIYSKMIKLVPITEMTDVISVKSKDRKVVSPGTWVRVKNCTYKGDLAQVIGIDNVQQKVTVKLVPRIDLQAVSDKLNGKEVVKKAIVPPPRLMNINEAREKKIRVERRRDPVTGEYLDNICGNMFKDGFLYKRVSLKSITSQNVQPTFNELERFQQSEEDRGRGFPTLISVNSKKAQFIKGDKIHVTKGDLKNLIGSVEKVEQETVYIRPEMKGLPRTLKVNVKEICKFFELGDNVKVVSGALEGATGMVVKIEGHILHIVSDTTKEGIIVSTYDVVKISCEVNSQVTHVLLSNKEAKHKTNIDRNVRHCQYSKPMLVSDAPRYGPGSETPMHCPQTSMTPMREAGAAGPIHNGMRTPKHDRAWNPYAPMTPARLGI